MAQGLLVILSGPSGVGKGTLCRLLLSRSPALTLSISMTTRPPRRGETDGREYIFTSRDRFQQLAAEDAFLEWACVHEEYYGTPRRAVEDMLKRGSDCLLEIDIQGGRQVKGKFPQAVSIFVAPPSLEALLERIRGRNTEDEEQICRRVETARREMQAYREYDYLVVNDRLDDTVDLILAILEAERHRVSRGIRPPFWGGEED